MSVPILLLSLAVLSGFYVAWNIGANDVANAVGPAVGSGALKLRQAVIIAAIFEFAGAFFLGGSVSSTVESGIINSEIFSHNMMDYVYGMLASLLAAGLWLQIASYFGWPVSTTHSIVGAVVGFGLVLGGMDSIYWGQIGSIAASWLISPFLGGAFSFLIFSLIRRKILYHHNPVLAAKRLTPYLVFLMFFILSIIIFFGGLAHFRIELDLFEIAPIAGGIGIICAMISIILVKKIKEPHEPVPRHNIGVEMGLKKVQKHLLRVEAISLGLMQDKVRDLLEEVRLLSDKIECSEVDNDYILVEKIFIYLQIIIACFMAFAHGSNDVANTIGPLSAIFNIIQGQTIHGTTIPFWLLFLGGIGIVFGLATWGWRVIETVGRKITALTPSRSFAAGFGAAVTIMIASKLGLPISTTHVLVGAVLGVGFARGIGAINLRTIRDILISWMITVPAGAILSIFFFWIISLIFS
ncbi:MAG: anion permease [Chlamydiales bacterium]